MRHFGPAFWTKWKLDVVNIQHSLNDIEKIQLSLNVHIENMQDFSCC